MDLATTNIEPCMYCSNLPPERTLQHSFGPGSGQIRLISCQQCGNLRLNLYRLSQGVGTQMAPFQPEWTFQRLLAQVGQRGGLN